MILTRTRPVPFPFFRLIVACRRASFPLTSIFSIHSSLLAGIWTTSCSGCFEDIGICLYTCCCPACAHADVKFLIQGSDKCSTTLCGCICPIWICCCSGPTNRALLRAKFGNLPTQPCGDLLSYFCCQPCVQ